MKRLGVILLILVVLIVGAAVAARLYLSSSAAARQVAQSLRTQLGLPVEVEEAEVGLVGGTGLRGLRFTEPGGEASEPFLTVEEVRTDLTALDALRGVPPNEVTLSGVRLTLRFSRDGDLLTRLPESEGEGGSLPRIELRDVRVTLRQEGRREVTASGRRLEITPGDDGLKINGTIDDPYWGDWTVSASRGGAGAIAAELTTQDVAVTRRKLTELPFVPAHVWEEVTAEGRTPVTLKLGVTPGQAGVRYRVEMEPRDATVRVAAIDLDASGASGKVVVEDNHVRLTSVKGKAAGGSIGVGGDLDFRDPTTRMKFDVTASGLAVSQLPKSWRRRLPFESGRMSGQADLRLTVRDGKLTTGGSGKGVIEGVELAGGTGKIELRLRGDGGGYRFEAGTPTAHLMAAPVDDILQPSALAERLTGAAGDALAAVGRATNRAVDQAGRWGNRAVELLARAGKPRPAGAAPTYLDANLSFEDVQLAQLADRLGVKPPVPVSGRLSFQLRVEIPVDTPRDLKAYRLQGTVDLSTLRIADLRFEAAKARVNYRDGVLVLEELSGRLPGVAPGKGGSFAGKARLGVVPEGDLSFSLNVTDLPLAALDGFLPAQARGLAGAASGEVSGQAPFAGLADPARWRADAALKSPGVDYLGLRLRGLDVTARLEKGRLQVAKLQGKLEGAALTGSASLGLTGKLPFDSRLSLDGFDLAALSRLVPAFRPPVAVTGTVRLDARAKGALEPRSIDASGRVRTRGLTIDKFRLAAASFRWALGKDGVAVEDVRARLYGGEVTGSALLPIRDADAGRVGLTFREVDVGEALKAVTDASLPLDGELTGNVDATVTPAAAGKPRAVAAIVDVKKSKLRVQRVPAEDLNGTVRYEGDEVRYDLRATALGGKVRLEGRVPVGSRKEEVETEGELSLDDLSFSRAWRDLRLGTVPAPLRRALFSLNLNYRYRGGEPVSGRGRFRVERLSWDAAGFPTAVGGNVTLIRDGVRVALTPVTLGGGSLDTFTLTYPFRGRGGSFQVRLRQVESDQLLALLPDLRGALQGPITIEAGGRLSGESGGGTLTMARGRAFGVEVSNLRVPFALRLALPSGRGEVTVTDGNAQAGLGRATLRGSARWEGATVTRLDANVRLFDATLANLAADLGTYAQGRVTARIDLSGSDVRSANDLAGNIQATLEQAQATQLPVFRQIAPYLTPAGRSSSFQSGRLEARLGGGVVRIQRLELSGGLLQLFAQGAVTLRGGLDLDVTARTGSPAGDPVVLRLLALSVPAVGPVPVALLARVSVLLANRVIRLRVGGTIRYPQVRVQAIRLLTDEAARYFLFRLILPAAPGAR